MYSYVLVNCNSTSKGTLVYNECQYGGMYNAYVKRIFVITEIVHMDEKTGTCVIFEKEKVKESKSRSVTPSLDTPSGVGLGASQFSGIRAKV